MYALLRYLMMNRAGTRAGRATWLYLAVWATFLVANDVLVHRWHTLTNSQTEPAFIWFALLSPAILLLNRLDRSGPTAEQAQQTARAHAAAERARDLARRESTLAFRLGRWLRRRLG